MPITNDGVKAIAVITGVKAGLLRGSRCAIIFIGPLALEHVACEDKHVSRRKDW